MIPKYVHIENQDHLVRDTHSMGVINTNSRALEAAKRRKTEVLKRVSEEERTKTEIHSLRQEVTKLTALVYTLLGNL